MQAFYDTVYTVSQINQYLKEMLELDPNLRQITLRGELSNFTNHVRSGHFYFSLKDKAASMKAVMFRTNASRVRFRPESGMEVIVTGSVRLFERDGAVQFYCDHMEPEGVGALALAFEQRKKKLAAEGLFDPEHKKELPRYPKKIGIVTSKTGAALQDILNILSRRYPVAEVVLVPSLVQGEQAAQSICDGIHAAESAGDIDVLIIGRGGGSAEDLWCFNEESVARAVYSCTIPVISAVGHEIDITITDLVSDLRAPTPSAAAELVAPDLREMREMLQGYRDWLDRAAEHLMEHCRFLFTSWKERLDRNSPEQKISQAVVRLGECSDRLDAASSTLLERKRRTLLKNTAVLDALSPLKVLLRGYSVAYYEGKALVSSRDVPEGGTVRTLLADGEITSTVTGRMIKQEGKQDG